MSARRGHPRQHEFDNAMRSALHLAVDSVEPAQDGLEQIQAKISTRQSVRRRVSWRWRISRAPGGDQPWWRALLPPRGWFPAVVTAVVERFRPDPNRAGWFGWLRPAAAVSTGLFVVTAATLAAAALPSAIFPAGNGKHYTASSPTPKHRTSANRHPSYSSTSVGGTSPAPGQSKSGGPSPTATPTCSPTASGTPSTAPSGSPTSSSSSSPTVSPTNTATTSPTSPAQTTPTTSPTPGATSAATPGPAAEAPLPATSPVATGKSLLSPDAIAATELAENSGQAGNSGLTAASDGNGDTGAPSPSDGPQPSASPTPSGPASPYPSSSPLPPPPC
jgi:hypothetical protein